MDGEGNWHGERLTTKTSESLLLSHLSAPAAMDYGSVVHAWKILEIEYEARKLMFQDACHSLNSGRESIQAVEDS